MPTRLLFVVSHIIRIDAPTPRVVLRSAVVRRYISLRGEFVIYELRRRLHEPYGTNR